MNPFKIMIVEDEAVTAHQLKAFLEAEGYAVTSLPGLGEKAVVQAGLEKPDVVLMDIHLNGAMDGIEAAGILRREFGIPVIFMTAHADDETIRRAGRVMPVGYLVKPVETQALKAALETARQSAQAEAGRRDAEERLKESEYWRQGILQTAMDGFWITDMDGRLLEVNETYCRMSGYTRKELLTMRIADLEAEETKVDVSAHISMMVTRGQERFETRHRRKDGGVLDVEVSVQYRRVDGGRLVSFLRDITERKRSEEALRKGEAFLKTLVKAITSPVAVINADDYTIEMNNDSYGGNQSLGRKCHEVSHLSSTPCFGDNDPCPIHEIKRTKQPVTMEHIHFTPQGRARYVEIHAYPVFDGNGRLSRIIEYSVDITERRKIHNALVESEADLRQAQKTARLGQWKLDLSTGRLAWSDWIFDLFEVDRKTFSPSYEAFLKFIHPGDHDLVDRVYRDSLESKTPYEIDHRLLMKDGRVKWVHEAGHTEYDREGKPLRSVGSVQEITERKQSEERIRRERKNFLKIFEAAPVGLMLLDSNTVIRYANQTAADLVSRAPADLIGQRGGGGLGCVHSLENPGGCGSGSVCPGCPLRNGLESVLAGGQSIHGAEIVLTLVINGKPRQRWLKVNVEPIEIDHEPLVIVAVDDITRSKQAEDALKESETVSNALAEMATALLAAESIDAVSDLALHNAKTLTGSRHGFVGHIDPGSGHLVSTTLSHDIWEECRVTDKTYVFEHFKGLWGWVLNHREPLMTNAPAADLRSMGIPAGHLPIERFVSVPVMLEGKLLGQIALANADRDYTDRDIQTLQRLAGVYSLALQRLQAEQALQRSHDLLEERVAARTAELENANRSLKIEITRRKQLEAETIHKSRLASVGELAAGVAHEINNPINVIINYAQILADESTAPQDPQAIPNRIIKEADRVAAIVRNLLNFARESDDMPGFCDIAAIVGDSLELMRKQLDRPPPVMASFHKMQQVFVNLFSNARHALNAKYQGVDADKHIEIESGVIEAEGHTWMRTTVADNGTGIPANHLDKLFEPFFSTKPKGEGTGLGLSISYGIVRENGGQIGIESEEGAYTRVIIDLPLAKYDRVIRPGNGSAAGKSDGAGD
jgi:PAS domain S-box-containing protein